MDQNKYTKKTAHNFGAGPCILPQEVFEEASRAVLDFNNTGLSILEISHRSSEFEAVMNETQNLLREAMDIPKGYSVLFLQGGGSQQFAMVPMNLLAPDKTASYLDTGVWAKKAIIESARIGLTEVTASSAGANYNYIPKDYTVPQDAAYLHYTTNNTIYGTEFFYTPSTSVPLVADMSSDILSRPVDVSDFGLIYAGAQKNLGPAGLTVVIIKDELVGLSGRKLPRIFDYREHIEAGSLYNTPPVFSIYVMMLNLRWLLKSGGVTGIEKSNVSRASLLYKEIDENPLFSGTAVKEDRSIMNITFLLNNHSLQEGFLKMAKDNGIVGIKGYRTVGGFRVSNYNALQPQSMEALVQMMKEFTRING